MSEKVVLPKEVADELQGLRNQGWTDYKIVHHIYEQWNHVDEETPMAAFAKRHNFPFLRALADGFQVELSPEEKVRDYYEQINPDTPCGSGSRCAIRETLNALDIKIEGVNA